MTWRAQEDITDDLDALYATMKMPPEELCKYFETVLGLSCGSLATKKYQWGVLLSGRRHKHPLGGGDQPRPCYITWLV